MNQHLRKKARLTSFLRKALKPFFAVCALTPVFAFHTASAQSLFWDAGNTGATGNWDLTTTNWSASTPPTTATAKWTQQDTAIFAGTTPSTITLTGGTNIQATGIQFLTGTSVASSYNITDDGTASLVFVGNSTVTVGTGISAIFTTTLVTDTFSAVPANDTLTFTGPGTVYLNANNATYSVPLLAITGGVTVVTSATSALPNVATVIGTGGTAGTLDLFGSAQSIASLAGDSLGVITNSQAGYANLTIGGPTTPTSPTTYAGTITDTAATIETTNNAMPANALGITIAGPASGYTLILTGTNNTYHGMTVVGDGTNPVTLQAGIAGAFSPNSAVNVNANGTLDLNGFSQTIAALNGAGTGTVTNTSPGSIAVLTLNGDAGGTDTLSSSANLIDHATVAGFGTLALTKSGTYTQLLSGNNTYGGATIVNNGTLAAGSAFGFSPNSLYTINSSGISSGILDLNGFSASTGSLSGNGTVVNGSGTVTGPTAGNATLTVGSATSNLSSTFTGLIEDSVSPGAGGTLTLTKNGGGVLTLTNTTNSYTGGTNINQGTLSFASAAVGTATALGTTGTIEFTGSSTLQFLTNNAPDISSRLKIDDGVNATIDTNNNNETFNNAFQTGVAKTGALTKTGLGTLTLTAANSYSGGTNINQGTLNFVSGALGSGTTTFTGNSTLQWAAGNAQDVSANGLKINDGVIGTIDTGTNSVNFLHTIQTGPLGTGGLTKAGTGILTLTGANTYSGATTVNAGTLKAGSALGFSQNSAFTVNSSATLDIFGSSPAVGSLAGVGTVTNSGALPGILTTGHDNTSTTFSGLLTDGTSTFALTKTGLGALTLGSANTYSGGTTLLGGTLIIANSGALGKGNVTVTGGALQAGGANTTIQVNGNYSQGANGELDLRIGGTTPGTFDRLAVMGSASLSGRLGVSSINGFIPQKGETLTVITAGGGVTGQFQQVTGSLSNYPLIKLTLQYLPGSVVLDFGQGSFMVAATNFHLNLTPNEEAVADALDHVSKNSKSAKLLTFLDSLPLTSLPGALDLIAPAEYGAIYEISRSAAKMEAATIENRMDEVHAAAFSSGPAGPAGPSDYKGSKEIAPPSPDNRLSVFANGSGEFVSVGDSFNAAGYNFDSGGVTAGADYRFTDHFVAGVLFDYTGTEADLVNNGRINANAFRGGVYASLFGGGAYLNAFVGAGYNDYDVTRLGLGGNVRGDTNGADLDALIATGYDFHAGGVTFGPVASFQYTYTGLNSFNESGSLDPLHIDSGYGTSFLSNVGVRATYDWHIGSMVLVPEVRATWQHEYGNTFDEISATMLLGSPAFTVTDSPIGRDSLVVNAGFTLRITPNFSTYAFYDGELARTNYQANNVMVGFRVSF